MPKQERERRRQVNFRTTAYIERLTLAVAPVLSRKIGLPLSHADLHRLGLLALAEKHGIPLPTEGNP